MSKVICLDNGGNRTRAQGLWELMFWDVPSCHHVQSKFTLGQLHLGRKNSIRINLWIETPRGIGIEIWRSPYLNKLYANKLLLLALSWLPPVCVFSRMWIWSYVWIILNYILSFIHSFFICLFLLRKYNKLYHHYRSLSQYFLACSFLFYELRYGLNCVIPNLMMDRKVCYHHCMILTWKTVPHCNLIVVMVFYHTHTHTVSILSQNQILKYIHVFFNVGITLQVPTNSMYFSFWNQIKENR